MNHSPVPRATILAGATAEVERGIELVKPEPGKVGFHGLHHDAKLFCQLLRHNANGWPGREWTGPSGKQHQDTFADRGKAGLKNGSGRGWGGAPDTWLSADTHRPSRSDVTDRWLQILLRTALQRAGWVWFLRIFPAKRPKKRSRLAVACGFVT